MKLVIISLVLFGMNAFAALPVVKCELTYVKLSPDGHIESRHTNKNITVQNRETTSKNEGFVLKAILDQVCATTHGPCYNAYDLEIAISKGDSTSFTSESVKTTAKSHEIFSSLGLKDEQGFVKCVVNSN